MGFKKVALSGQLADIDIKLLRIFKAVVDAQGITAAEAELNLANSTISNYISDLEKRLDMRLCERGRKGFVVTEQGHLVYEASIELLAALYKFRNTINDSYQSLTGELHLICAEQTIGIGDYCIAKTIDSFKEIAPNVNLIVSVMESNTIVGAIVDNKADIGITVPMQHYPKLHSVDLFNETMLLYCSIKHPAYNDEAEHLKETDLLQYKFVESPRLRAGKEPHPDIKKWNLASKAHHQEARMSLILSGHYLGFLPSQLVNQWGLDHELKPLFIEKYSYENTYRAISNRRSNNQSLINIFKSLLVKNLN